MRDELLGVFTKSMKNQKVNYSKIARQYNCDWRTVKRYHKNDPSVLVVRKPREINKITDGFEDVIKHKFLEEKANAKAIFDVLCDNYGFKGSYSTVKRFCREIREQKVAEAILRFETNPGLQCQIDWKEKLTLVNRAGEEFEINIFLAVLGFSRLKYIEITLDRSQTTLFHCLTNAFKYFKGVPKELLFDNMRTVVDKSRTQFGNAVFNKVFEYFANDAGFVPKACLAYRPETKGKVESVANLMNRVYAYNYEFDTFEELIIIGRKLLEKINSEIHGTTLERPIDRFQKEKEYLNPEPNYDILIDYFNDTKLNRKVSKESLINFRGKRYSVPKNFINKNVTLQCVNDTLEIYYEGRKIAEHSVSSKPINYDSSHYKEIFFQKFKDNDLTRKQCEMNLSYFDKLGD